jgi:hypothetical protein
MVVPEAPGAADAAAVGDAVLKRNGLAAESVVAGLRAADAVGGARVIRRLQQERGSAFVQRVIARRLNLPGQHVGLSAVGLPMRILQREPTTAPEKIPDAGLGGTSGRPTIS